MKKMYQNWDGHGQQCIQKTRVNKLHGCPDSIVKYNITTSAKDKVMLI